MLDQFSTPADLAQVMAESARCKALPRQYMVIADFAVGSGQLLRVARSFWPNARFIATDVDGRMIRTLRRTEPEWDVGQCDFLDPRSRRNCRPLRGLACSVSLVLLNPPFSCRGGKRVSVALHGQALRCSISLGFLIASVDFIAPHGEIVAVLPAGSLGSEKDEAAWAALRSLGSVEVVAANGHRAFPDATPKTVIVRFSIGRPAAPGLFEQQATVFEGDSTWKRESRVSIIRGQLRLHVERQAYDGGAIPLVHSTELRDGDLDLTGRQVGRDARSISGPMVLLPRVGQPKSDKIVYHPRGEVFAISDCVVALICDTDEEARSLYLALLAEWKLLERNYVGSCAKYITIRRLTRVIDALGFRASAGRDDPAGTDEPRPRCGSAVP